MTNRSAAIVNTATLGLIGSVPLNSSANGLPLSIVVSPAPTRALTLTDGGSLAFGEVHVGATKVGTLAIINGGNGTMTLNGIIYPAGFSGASGAGMSLLPGGVLFLPVTFAPAVPGPYTGTITVNANHTSGTNTIAVSGTGSLDSTRDGDFDADGKTDLVVYRPTDGKWYILKSAGGFTTASIVLWGVNTDLPVPGDYDGDGKTDIAVYRPSSGHWFVKTSSSNYTTFFTMLWGNSGDVPVPGDYDGDDKTDIAVYRPSTGVWYVPPSSNFTTVSHYWGLPGDVRCRVITMATADRSAVRRSSGHRFALPAPTTRPVRTCKVRPATSLYRAITMAIAKSTGGIPAIHRQGSSCARARLHDAFGHA